MEFESSDRLFALAAFLEGPQRSALRRTLESNEAWAQRWLERFDERWPQWDRLQYRAFAMRNLRSEMDERERDKGQATIRDLWMEIEQDSELLFASVTAHIAHEVLRRADRLLSSPSKEPSIIVQIAQQFVESEEGKDFMREESELFLAKMAFDEEDCIDLPIMRMHVSEKLAAVATAVRGEIPPSFSAD